MQVTGLGLKNALFLPDNIQDDATVMNQTGFNQILSTVQTKQKPANSLNAQKADKEAAKAISDLLLFLNKDDLLQFDGGKALLNQLFTNPQTDMLTLVKDFLGISEQKWSEMMTDLSKGFATRSGAGKVTNGASTTKTDTFPENAILLFKSLKLANLLSAYQGGAGSQSNLAPLLEAIKEKLLVFSKTGNRDQQLSNSNWLNSRETVLPDHDRTGSKIKHSYEDTPFAVSAIQNLLSVLQANDPRQINGGAGLLNQHGTKSITDLFQLVKDAFGISNETGMPNIKVLNGTDTLTLKTGQMSQQPIFPTNDDFNMNTIPAMSLPDLFQLIKNNLGINEQQWSKILDQLNSDSNRKLAGSAEEPVPKIMTGLAKLAADGNSKSSNQFNITQLLEIIKEKLSDLNPDNISTQTRPYFKNTFLKIVTDAGLNSGAEKPKRTMAEVPNWGTLSLNYMSKPEQLSIMLNDSPKNAAAGNIMRQFEALLARSHFSNTAGVQRLFIKLSPANLGSLSIELVQKDHTLVARILASSTAAKDVLESQLNGLKSAFAAQNIQVDRVEVGMQPSQSPQEPFSNRNQQNQQDQNNGQYRQEMDHNDDEPQDGDFTLSLEEALFNTEA